MKKVEYIIMFVVGCNVNCTVRAIRKMTASTATSECLGSPAAIAPTVVVIVAASVCETAAAAATISSGRRPFFGVLVRIRRGVDGGKGRPDIVVLYIFHRVVNSSVSVGINDTAAVFEMLETEALVTFQTSEPSLRLDFLRWVLVAV
jgi:hypothetical protein